MIVYIIYKMANSWTRLVKEKFRLGRLSNPAYTLGEAMKSAKKVYKKGVEISAIAIRSTRGRKKGGKHSRKTRGRKH